MNTTDFRLLTTAGLFEPNLDVLAIEDKFLPPRSDGNRVEIVECHQIEKILRHLLLLHSEAANQPRQMTKINGVLTLVRTIE